MVRKCIYRNCGHTQAHKCKMHSFPQESVIASRWLSLAGVYNKTPKKLLSSWRICSCHFEGGKEVAGEPTEFVEDVENNVELLSPPKKRSREGLEQLTPNTKTAVEALLGMPSAEEIVHTISKPALYSPSRSYWQLRSSAVRKSRREKFQRMLDPLNMPADSGTTGEDLNNNSSSTHNAMSDHIDLLPVLMNEDTSGASNVGDELESYADLGIALLSEVPSESTCDGTGEEKVSFAERQFNIGPNLPTPPDSASDASGKTHFSFAQRKIDFDRNLTAAIPGKCCTCGGSMKDPVSRKSIGIQCNRSFLSYDRCKQLSETEFSFYTGLTQETFELLYAFLGGDEICSMLKYEYSYRTPKREQFSGDLSPKDKLFMTLLRLRRGMPLRDLKVLFNVSEGHASKIAYTWIRFMSLEFKKLESLMFMSASSQDGVRPKYFRRFKNLRVVIDCFEIKIQRSTSLQQQANSYSSYKSSNTIKFLVGISCLGGLSFLSEGYEGSISDRKLVEMSGFLDHLIPGDAVMADKGFDIEDKCDEKEVELIIPAFLRGRDAFTARELIFSRAISESRVFVECFIGKVKPFRLVRYMIPNSMLPIASDLVRVCAFLVNFQMPYMEMNDEEEH